MLLPSFIYAAQNNLLYVALSNLDAATFQVSYQIKILTTAFFSVVLLRRSLTKLKWGALFILLVGVATVQIHSEQGAKATEAELGQNRWIGLTAVLVSAISSGFAGCYFEKVMKSSEAGMMVQNIQLGLFGTLFSILGVLFTDFHTVVHGGLLRGFTWPAGLVILNQAVGGLLVSAVVKYADSILKGFATSVSIVLSSIISIVWMAFVPTREFMLGSSLVLFAVYLYSL